MRRAEDLLPPDEQARLAVCAQEPLHAAGSVQPHGVLLAAEPTTGEVVRASANTVDLLGEPVDRVLGRTLHSLLGVDVVDAVRSTVAATLGGAAGTPVTVELPGGLVDLVAHESSGLLLVEAEPSVPAGDGPLAWLGSAMRRAGRAPHAAPCSPSRSRSSCGAWSRRRTSAAACASRRSGPSW